MLFPENQELFAYKVTYASHYIDIL